jgi:bcr-type benzoyl-CoA reductase subunit C
MTPIDTLLPELEEISKNPKLQLSRYRAEGRKVVGCLPYFVPEELVYASGMLPFGLWGAELQTAEAKRYCPAFICALLQTTLELGIRGAFDGLTAVMIPALCDSLKGMNANWRYGVPNVPVIHVAQAQNRKTPAGIEFTAAQYRKIKGQLSELSGRDISDSDVADAVRVYNDHRAVMRRFADAAASKPGRLKPSQRCAVYKSAYFMDVKEHTARTAELTAALEAADAPSFKGPKLITSGIIADNTGLLGILDDCGVAVVRDAVTHESIRYQVDVPVTDDPIEGLAKQLGEIEGCPVLFDPGKKRGTALIELVKQSGADGVLFTATKFCDPEEYDEVPLKRMLDNAGIRSLRVETDKQTANAEQARTAVETFCEILRQ